MSSDILQKQKVFREKLTGKLFCVRSIMRLKVVGSLRGGGGRWGKGEVGVRHLILYEKYGWQQDFMLPTFKLEPMKWKSDVEPNLGQY